MSHRRLVPAVLVVALLVAAACGQKSGVEGTETAVAADGGGGGGDTGGGGGEREPGENDTAGITDTEIVIGIHAPVTGASPIPQETFDIGKDIFWNFLAATNPEALGGRTVRVVFRDDEFNPNRAVQVCREMVEEEGAFLLVGAAGADQITACAQYADENDIPYLSLGVNTEGLEGLGTYFAASLTYEQQNAIVIDQIEAAGAEKVGVVVIDTPSFNGAHDDFVDRAEEAGLDLVVDDVISKTAGESEAAAEAQELKNADAEIVYVLLPPTVYLSLAAAGRNQSFEPVFVGPGVTNGLNAVTRFGCPNVANGQFLSPFPELDVINEIEPDYIPAYEQFGGGTTPDDIGLALWGLNETLFLMFEATGPELGRAAFMNAIEAGETFEAGIFPPITYSTDDHFGGSGAYLLAADCSIDQYTTDGELIEVDD